MHCVRASLSEQDLESYEIRVRRISETLQRHTNSLRRITPSGLPSNYPELREVCSPGQADEAWSLLSRILLDGRRHIPRRRVFLSRHGKFHACVSACS